MEELLAEYREMEWDLRCRLATVLEVEGDATPKMDGCEECGKDGEMCSRCEPSATVCRRCCPYPRAHENKRSKTK